MVPARLAVARLRTMNDPTDLARGREAICVPLPPKTDLGSAREQLLAADADRFLLLLVNEWKSDVYANIGLGYNVRMDVLQSDGSTEVERAFRQKLEEMLGTLR